MSWVTTVSTLVIAICLAVWAVAPPQSELCARNAEALPKALATITAAPGKMPGLIIDAILGAGAVGRPRDTIAQALQALRSCQCPVRWIPFA